MTLCNRKNSSDGRSYHFDGSAFPLRLFSFLFVALLFLGSCAHGQNLSSSVVASAGSTASGGGLMVDWTLGENAVSLFGNDQMLVTEGFHQPIIVTALAVEQLPGIYAIDLYPNPSSALVTVRLTAAAEEHYALDLLDVRGFTLIHREGEAKSASINLDLRELTPATYFLRVLTNRSANASIYKIIKIQ